MRTGGWVVWAWAVACGLVAAPETADALTYSVRAHWQPSTDAGVAGYRVYLRRGTGTLAPALDAGMPPRLADGSLAAVVGGLEACVGYGVAVAAYRADGTTGPMSNEVALTYASAAPRLDSDRDGLTNAAEDRNLDCVVDAGETDPARADTDGDGVLDGADACQGTPAGAAVDTRGCACAQIACDDGNPCNGRESCTAGVCQAGTPLVCNDGNACTADACSAATGCTFTPVAGCAACATDADCDDGRFCTGAESCRAGVCVAGTPVACDDGDVCTADACDESLQACTHTAGALVCADPGPCADAACDPVRGCVTTPVPDGTPCDDNDPCTPSDVCTAGVCGAGTLAALAGEARGTALATRRSPAGLALRAWTSFAAPDGFDLRDGALHVAAVDETGRTLLDATVEGARFTRDGDRAMFSADDRAGGGGLLAIALRPARGRIRLVVRALVPATGAADRVGAAVTTGRTAKLEWSLKTGSQCVGGSGQCKGRGRRCR
jgi:hypothetical protein